MSVRVLETYLTGHVLAGASGAFDAGSISYHKNMCHLHELDSVGCWGISHNGNCTVNALAQHLSPFSACEVDQQAGLGEELQAEVHHQALQFLRSDNNFAALLKRNAVNVSSKHKG